MSPEHPTLSLSLVHPLASERAMPAVLIRSALTPRHQFRLYEQLCSNARHSYDALSRRAATQIGRGPPPEEEGVKHLLSQLDDPQFDSLVSLLYDSPGALRPHVDDGLPGVGLSLSLGSACVFEYGGVEMVLSSGDVLIGAFGFVIHQVSSGDVGTATFGRARCNLQLRRGRYFASRKKVNSCGCVNGTQSC
ncbi:MAG: hypothetical protein SGPRY_011311 [Prymnesium sp.]